MVDTFTYQIARDLNIDSKFRLYSYRNGIEAWNYGTQICVLGETVIEGVCPGRGEIEFALSRKFPGCEFVYRLKEGTKHKVQRLAAIKLPSINAQWTGKQWTEELEVIRHEYQTDEDGGWAFDIALSLQNYK